MAGRKRKLLAQEITGTHSEYEGSCNREAKIKPATQKETSQDGNDQETEFKRSHYFTGSDHLLRLGEDFYNQPCITLAKALLGKVLVRLCADGTELRGRIVETEAYLGGEDKASHSAGGKRTKRNAAMFMKPGTVYVYPIYGIYLCMNISSEGEGAAVLLRSLQPLQGQPAMKQLRSAKRKEGARPLKDKELCNGPSKLCQALDIPRSFDRRDLASDPDVWLEKDPGQSPPEGQDIISAPRIGIESHGEWAKKPWRFYLRGHPCVSVLNKEAERVSPSGNIMKDSGPSEEKSTLDSKMSRRLETETTLPSVSVIGNTNQTQ